MAIQEAERTGKLVLEAENVCFAYHEKPVITDFSTTLLRGDLVGMAQRQRQNHPFRNSAGADIAGKRYCAARDQS
ncbi:MAG: hypothetical protein R2861_02185 [Desulfobacterales bacterium]